MQIDIIVVYVPRYMSGHEKNFVPPVTGIYLAALTPPKYNVRVIHQQVNEVEFDTPAQLIALSFFSGFAREAYRLAAEFRKRGKMVVAGGPHVTFAAEEALQYVDSVVTGEAESVWTQVLDDAAVGRLQPIYAGTAAPLDDNPTPRYDLLPKTFFIPRVVQATRGCPFTCSFCTVPTLNPGFRTRPVPHVIADISYDNFRHWWQRKIVWFWDDNLTIRRDFITRLLEAMIPLKRWWLTQASMDIATDSRLLDLMRRSGCIGIFFGMESFGEDALRDARKRQNKAATYRERIAALHQRGICVMAGFISGFDSDSEASIRAMARRLYDAGVDVPFLSILTPFPGTALYDQYVSEFRMREECGWEFYNGYNVAFRPKLMSPAELLQAHRDLWREAFSLKYSLLRIVRSAKYLRLGAWMMCAMMNSFYCWKRMRGNLPVSFEGTVQINPKYSIEHSRRWVKTHELADVG